MVNTLADLIPSLKNLKAKAGIITPSSGLEPGDILRTPL